VSDYYGPMGEAEILDVTEQEYHADPCEVPSLSSSIAKLMVEESPEKAWTAHPRLGGVARRNEPVIELDEPDESKPEPKRSSKAMDAGKVVHRLLLGRGADFVGVDAKDWRTNAAKEARKAAEAEGKVALLKERLAGLRRAADAIGERLDREFNIRFAGRSEVVVTWRERVFLTDDAEVVCRGMFDHLFLEEATVIDLKTCYSANPDDCAKAISDHGYHIQRGAYTSALRKLVPAMAGHEDFINVFAELKPPYAVFPTRMDGNFRKIGDVLWQHAVRRWHECTQSGKWPGYADGQIAVVSPKTWVLKEALARGIEVDAEAW
jgi:ATP-dependent exoDNAse (exonuclease V) beta subunit